MRGSLSSWRPSGTAGTALLAALLLCVNAGCARELRIQIALPGEGFDTAVVALAKVDPEGLWEVVAHTGVLRVGDDAPSLSAQVDPDAVLRVAAFLYHSDVLAAELDVAPELLPAAVEVVLAPLDGRPLPGREPNGDRLSAAFGPPDAALLTLPAVKVGTPEAATVGSIASQLSMVAETKSPPKDGGSDARSADAEADAATDSGVSDGGIAALGPFGPPTLIAQLADPAFDDSPTLTGDLLEIYFVSDRIGGPGSGDIWTSVRATASDPWGPPVLVSELSTGFFENTPEVSHDGLTLWFGSDRSGGSGGIDIWVSTRPSRTSSWSLPAPVTELNTPDDEFAATPRADTLVMVLTSNRAGGFLADLYSASRASPAEAWSVPMPIAELNTPSTDSTGFLSPGGFHLFLTSDRPGGMGGRDLYRGSRLDVMSPFELPLPVTALNTTDDDTDPWLSDDLRYVVFASDRTGNLEIYEAFR